MLDMNPMLLCDTYKTVHNMMYPEGLEYLVSYWVPRKSYFEKEENQKMVWFGLQAFIKEYLVEYFEKNFFSKTEEEIVESYRKVMDVQLDGFYKTEPIVELHRLGYLPLQINALPEGSKVNMGIPCIELTNTDQRFAWLVQWVECLLQVELWKICNDATIGNMYYRLAKYWYDKNADDNLDPRGAFSNFDMRGDDCLEVSARTAAAWLLSSNKTSTIPALPYIDKYYAAHTDYYHIGVGAISTEHSVISCNTGIGVDEEALLKKFLTDTFKDKSFSFLGDTYDYWNVVNNIVPACKDEILAHNGKLLIRPDSGDMVDITIRTIQKFWEVFGGTVNSKGYKVLDPHIGLIYGDGCTMLQLRKIWKKLDEMGFAANNVVFGIGAFCFKAIFEGDRMVVNTRDMFGCAMKATYAIVNGESVMIYKDPKTDTNKLKKSHKGLVFVEKTEDGFKATDGFDYSSILDYGKTHETAFVTYFRNGKILHFEVFNKIRARLTNEN